MSGQPPQRPPLRQPGPDGQRPLGPPGASRPAGPPGSRPDLRQPGPPGPRSVGPPGPPGSRPTVPRPSGPSDMQRPVMPRPTGPAGPRPTVPGGPPTGRVARPGPVLTGPPARPSGAVPPPGRGVDATRAGVAAGRALVDPNLLGSNLQSLHIGRASGSGSSGDASSGSGRGVLGAAVAPGEGACIGRASAAGPRPREGLLRTRPTHITSKKGEKGTALALLTNHFALVRKPSWKLFQYRVDFLPETDNTFEKKALFRNLMPLLGNYIFDGSMLFNTNQLVAVDADRVHVVNNRNNEPVTIRIRLTGELSPDTFQFTQFMNIVMKQILQAMNLKEIRREYYDPKAKVELRAEGLEVWPGYITSLRQHEESTLLCCELKSKILRIDSVWDILQRCLREHKANAPSVAQRMLLGQIVMTKYNNKTLKIDDIDFNDSPKSDFPSIKSPTGKMTLLDYYKTRYGITIRDPHQPIIISQPTAAERRRYPNNTPHKLIPELCFVTGLSDDQKGNYKLMATVKMHTQTAPPQRVEKLRQFARTIATTPQVQAELAKWDMKLSENLIQIRGRVLDAEAIKTAGTSVTRYQSSNAEWQGVFRNKLFVATPCHKWGVIFPAKDEVMINNFLSEIKRSAVSMGIPMSPPVLFKIPDTRLQTYIMKLNDILKNSPDLIMTVVPNNKGEVYHAVKKVCYVENPVPSQVMTMTVLNKAKSLAPIATKVAAQMAAKLGSELWSVDIPLKGLMVVGYDTFHDTSKKDLSVGAIVCTINNSLTKYISYTALHRNGEELCTQFKSHLTSALRVYKEVNNTYPSRIIIYRDGVGDGQIEHVSQIEILPLKAMLMKMVDGIKFTYIIVSKRINTRFMSGGLSPGAPPSNPPSGTVVDDIVTLPERYDFFLISQSVRQGTVNPTSYNVVEDSSALKPDQMQILTYKMTHLYYNWPGVVRVPAVCQYAHKLASLVGQSLHTDPHAAMQTSLYYL